MSQWDMWVVIGFAGQFVFGMRFFLQWIYSEKKGESVIPDVFWYCSIIGGIILLSYAIHQRDPVFIVGQSTGVLVYARNLYFIHRKRKQQA